MISDTEWEEFYRWCKEAYPMWAPDRMTIRLYLEWLESKEQKEE